MRFKFTHTTNPFATHQPVLYEAVMRSKGPILELGSGDGSTPMLRYLCTKQERELITADNDPEWLSRYQEHCPSFHELILVPDWPSTLPRFTDRQWGVIFVDSSPWESRSEVINLLRYNATYIVLHDCNYYPENGLLDFEDAFSSWREYLPEKPWPLPTTGPPTLLGSNVADCNIDIDYSRYINARSIWHGWHRVGKVVPALAVITP